MLLNLTTTYGRTMTVPNQDGVLERRFVQTNQIRHYQVVRAMRLVEMGAVESIDNQLLATDSYIAESIQQQNRLTESGGAIRHAETSVDDLREGPVQSGRGRPKKSNPLESGEFTVRARYLCTLALFV